MHVNNFFVCGPKVTVFFSSNLEGVVVDQLIFDLSIRFGDIRDQSRKLSEILDGFLHSHILGCKPSLKWNPHYHPWLAARRMEKRL